MALLNLDRSRSATWICLASMAISAAGCMLLSRGSARAEAPAFDHAVHAEEGLECGDCHVGAGSDDEPGMPSAPQCMLCHEELDKEKPPEKRIADRFTEGKYRAQHFSRLSEEVVFSHAAHVARGVECAACHGAVASSRRVDPDVALTMDECLTCHATNSRGGRSDECSTCHREIREDVRPASHDLAWQKVHGTIVRAHGLDTADRCSLCHTESSCKDCHADSPPANHDNFWRIRGHGLAASMDRQNCAACHEADSCQRCHEETLPFSHTGMWGAPRDTHCLTCHLPLQGSGCAVCHRGTPSHDLATPMPPWHDSGMNCRQCHGVGEPLPHVDNGSTCTGCHR